jgi:5-methylcytosine-specific restriction endonuclease McrA
MDRTIESFRSLSDDQLLEDVRILVAQERSATTVLVASLAEVDARQLYLPLGFSSLFAYCTVELGMSDGAAYRRMTAARVVRRFPIALAFLEDGSLTLTNLTVLGPSLTDSNHVALLEAARRKTRREVERQVAALHPDRPELISIHLRVRRETFEKLRRAKDLLRHAVPDGNVAEILDRALVQLIADLERKKLGKVRRPRRARKAQISSRYIPSALKRAVSERDEGRCTFVGPSGRCPETGFLEFHHAIPYARGGPTSIDNLRLRCRAHNQYEAEQDAATGVLLKERRPAYGSAGFSP